MGYLYYGNNGYAIQFDDRSLAHLKVAILSALRAGKSIAFSFDRSVAAGSGRETLWISPSSELRFRFTGSRMPTINEAWLRRLIATANGPSGLRLVPETDEGAVLSGSAG